MALENSLFPPEYIQVEENLPLEFQELISVLPTEKGWVVPNLYKYEGFWYTALQLRGVIACKNQFRAQDSDIFLVTTPKSGTTWLKAIMFTLVNRKRYPPSSQNHPLLNKNPHDLVPFFEIEHIDNQISDSSSSNSSSFPKLLATHLPYSSLPRSVQDSACKLVYLCRNPKDTFVSLWHFTNKLNLGGIGKISLEEGVDKFCNGVTTYGPYWDHVLGYWNKSKKNSDKILFLKYEDMKDGPGFYVRRLAKFLGCPFSAGEEGDGVVEEILKLCSFDSLSKLEINNSGKLAHGYQNKAYFRRGEVGDWKNHLTTEMVKKLDQTSEEKFSGVGLVF